MTAAGPAATGAGTGEAGAAGFLDQLSGSSAS